MDDIYIYTVGNGNGTRASILQKIPRAGGTATTLASDGRQYLNVAVDDESVYWSAAPNSSAKGSILKIAKAGGPITTIATNQDVVYYQPQELAVASNHVYWEVAAGSRVSGIRTVSISGGQVTTIPGSPWGPMVTYADRVFINLQKDPGHPYSSPCAWLAVEDGSRTTLLAAPSRQSCAQRAAADGTNIYWAEALRGGAEKAALLKLSLR
jgi:hypothetical protein